MSSDKPFEPTLSDVLVVRAMLAKTTILPELVGTILDYAEYWARSSARAQLNEVIAARIVGQGEFDYEENQFLLRSYPVGLTERAYEEEEEEEEDGNAADDDSSSREERFSTIIPHPLPVFKEFDRDFFQRAIKNASTFSNPARKIVFRIRSHDQGWTTDDVPGPFVAAKTWFDAGIERFDASSSNGNDMKQWTARKLGTIEPQVKEAKDAHEGWDYRFPYTPWKGPYEIQRNRMASSEFTDYEVTWTCWDVITPDSPEALELMEQGKGRRVGDGRFVRNLKLGDVVTVWGRAMHRGWINTVESVQIDIYWAL